MHNTHHCSKSSHSRENLSSHETEWLSKYWVFKKWEYEFSESLTCENFIYFHFFRKISHPADFVRLKIDFLVDPQLFALFKVNSFPNWLWNRFKYPLCLDLVIVIVYAAFSQHKVLCDVIKNLTLPVYPTKYPWQLTRLWNAFGTRCRSGSWRSSC